MAHLKMALPVSRLAPLLAPRSVAIVGASPRENTLGNNVVVNLRRFGYAGRILPVHPSAPEVAGLPAYRATRRAARARRVRGARRPADKDRQRHSRRRRARPAGPACGFCERVRRSSARKGGRGQRQLQALCAKTGIVLCGPNCLGLVNVHKRVSLYSSGIPEGMRDGRPRRRSPIAAPPCIALSTLGRSVFLPRLRGQRRCARRGADISSTSPADSETKGRRCSSRRCAILLAFARAMRAMHAAGKSVIALKVGRSAKGAAASAAHTGSLAGSWDAYQAYFGRHGVIAVDDFDELAESVELAMKIRAPPQG
jgi:hypothetical protein